MVCSVVQRQNDSFVSHKQSCFLSTHSRGMATYISWLKILQALPVWLLHFSTYWVKTKFYVSPLLLYKMISGDWWKWLHLGCIMGQYRVTQSLSAAFGFCLFAYATWTLISCWTALLLDIWIPLRFGGNLQLTPMRVPSVIIAKTVVSNHFSLHTNSDE